ncbi:MAG: DUF5810 domain-containing protein [Halococcoides sp.]
MYECPVCGDRQVDRRHLADHLAITASIEAADHERWLDAHASEWPDLDTDQLADRIAEAVSPVADDPGGPSIGREAETAEEARDAFRAGLEATDEDSG